MDPQTEEALVASKVDHVHEGYSQLLRSQLDGQRAYYSDLLEKQAEEAESRAQESSERCQSLEQALQTSTTDAKNAERKCRATENKMVSCSSNAPLRQVSMREAPLAQAAHLSASCEACSMFCI